MIVSFFKKAAKVLWLLPGLLLWASFPPMGETTDCLFALAPLLWFARRGDAKASVLRWSVAGFVFWFATLSWMPAIVKNGGPWPLVVLGWFALAAYCTLYFALYGWLVASYWSWARRPSNNYRFRLLGILLVEPVLWCGLEIVRSRFLGGFAWNQLGVVPINAGFGAPAALGGVYLCSAIVILVNGTIAGIAERLWKPEQSGFAKLKRLGPLETLLVFAIVFGIYHFASVVVEQQDSTVQPETSNLKPAVQPETSNLKPAVQPETSNLEPQTLKVALVQRNFPCCFQGREENPVEIYSNLFANVSMLSPQLVVLPESAMAEFGPLDSLRTRRVAEWMSRMCGGAAVIAGGGRAEAGKIYNSAALYEEEGHNSTVQPSTSNLQPSIYDKVHLVPFGEFIPGDKLFPALQKLAPVGSCTPGELKLLNLHCSTSNLQPSTCPIGIAICFEDTDSAQMRRLAKMGAKMLVFITNDSWFSHSDEAVQHAWQARSRSVETGLPAVRVGNSGVTGVLTPDGKASWLCDAEGRPLVDARGTLFDRVAIPAAPGATPYVRFGDVPLFVAFALLILAMILVKYKAHHERRRTLSL